MSASTLSDWLQIAVIVFTVLATLSGIGLYFAQKVVDDQKSTRINQLEQGTTSLNKELSHVKEQASQLSPRSVPPDVRTRLIEALKPYPNQPVRIGWVKERETADFAQQIKAIFVTAGWFDAGSLEVGDGGYRITGIRISRPIPVSEVDQKVTDILSKEFSDLGLKPSIDDFDPNKLPPNRLYSLTIMVGLKASVSATASTTH